MLSVPKKSVRFLEPGQGSAGHTQDAASRWREAERTTPIPTTTTPPSPIPALRTRPSTTTSSQGRTTFGALSDSTTLGVEGDAAKPESKDRRSLSATTVTPTSQTSLEKGKPEEDLPGERVQTPFPKNSAADSVDSSDKEPVGDFANPTDKGIVRFETKNFLTRQGIVFKPKNPFKRKLITVYTLSAAPWEKTAVTDAKQQLGENSGNNKHVERIVRVETAEATKGTSKPRCQHTAYVVLKKKEDPKQQEGKPAPEIVYVKLEPAGCQSYIVPLKSAEGNSRCSQQLKPRNYGFTDSIPPSETSTVTSAATAKTRTRPPDTRLVFPSSATATKTIPKDILASSATYKNCTLTNNNDSISQVTSATAILPTATTTARSTASSDLHKMSGYMYSSSSMEANKMSGFSSGMEANKMSGFSSGMEANKMGGFSSGMEANKMGGVSSGTDFKTVGFSSGMSGGFKSGMGLSTRSGGYTSGAEIYGPVTSHTTVTLSRTQEKEELQQLNDRFAAYIQRMRMLAEKNNQVDSSALIASSKSLEIEMHNLKNLYEQELEKLRKELEACNHERTTYSMQVNKQVQCCSELQDRLKVEMDKNAKLQDEANTYERRISGLEAEIQDLRIAASRPQADIEQLQRKVDNLTREGETWRHRYEHEEVARLEAENKIQQLMKKLEFNDKINAERVAELHARNETSSATILSLESKVRDLSKTDVSVSEMLKQVRDTAEAELRKFQIDSDEQYNRNLTALKAQLDNDAKAVERLEVERTQLRGGIGELQAKIRSLEGQVANLEHQKQTLEEAITVERARAADSAKTLELKLREVQDMLVAKMREVTTAREQNIPLKAEIEALKTLLEEEEKRLRVPLGVAASSGVANNALTGTSAYNISSSATTATASEPAGGAAVAGMGTTSGGGAGNTVNFASSTSVGPTKAPVYLFTETAPYAPSPPLSLTYIPEALQTPAMTAASLSANPFVGGFIDYEPTWRCGEDLDPQLYGYTSTLPYVKYSYETTPGLNRLAVESSPPNTPRGVGPVRAKSAPGDQQADILTLPPVPQQVPLTVMNDLRANRERSLNLVSSNTGQGHDYFDQMFHDLQKDTLYSNGRPKNTPLKGTGRPLSSLYHDYTVSTSSATGDLKIFEVNQDGKHVRLLNDGVQEIEFGGYMLQQNVGGHPVAVYRFPPRTKFAPNSTITVYAGCNDHKLHNPPQEFVWKEQQKWGTGPECTTILCRPNGQAVAWTTAAHRFSRDAFQDGHSDFEDDMARDDEKPADDIADDDSLTEINVNVNEAKPNPVYLRREKQQPPSLQPNKHPHGNTPATAVHPNVNQPRMLRYGNDNSSNNRQSRSQSTRPDPVAGQPYAGAAAQKLGSAPLRKYVSGVSTQQSGVRCTGKSGGIIQGVPPYLVPIQMDERPNGSGGSSMSREGLLVRFTA